MSSFDLADALDDFIPMPENKGNVCHHSDMTDVVRLDEGLNLVISHNQKTLRHVGNLVLTLNRLRKPLNHSHNLSDECLLNAIMGSVVEETIVKVEQDCTTKETRYTFRRLNSEKPITVCDTSQKVLCNATESGQCKLQAVTLKGGDYDHKVNFKMGRYIPYTHDESILGQTVVLSIMNTELHIVSSMEDKKAVLALEKCSEAELKNISEDMNRFLFIKRTEGVDLITFESVKCRGWFISTSSGECHTVDMCTVNTANRLTTFKIRD